MIRLFNRRLALAAIAASSWFVQSAMASDALQNRPITIIYPYAAGSASDLLTRQVAEILAASTSGMATLAVPIHDAEEAFNPNAVKVVMDAQGYALYFSRATIPWDRDRFAHSRDAIGDSLLRHIGIYGYRAGFIRRYVSWAPSPLEQIEMLEQLRVLWYGEKIHVAVAAEVPGTGVDTPEDLARVRAELR